MGGRRLRTVGEVMCFGASIGLRCTACGHVGVVNPVSLVMRGLSGRPWRSLPFVCGKCGCRTMVADIIAPEPPPGPQRSWRDAFKRRE